MKTLIAGLVFWSLNCFAQEECASVWVYTAYKKCANVANGLDTTQAPLAEQEPVIWSDWLPGGRDQAEVCRNLRNEFNKYNERQGLFADVRQSTPVLERSENHIIRQEYRYWCELSVKKYPFKTVENPVCGLEDKLSYKIGGPISLVPGVGTCLSCDNLVSSPPETMVSCLRNNIEKVIYTQAIDLRESDIKAVAKQVDSLLKLNEGVPVKNLQSTSDLTFFNDFMRRYPSALGGGNRPTYQ